MLASTARKNLSPFVVTRPSLLYSKSEKSMFFCSAASCPSGGVTVPPTPHKAVTNSALDSFFVISSSSWLYTICTSERSLPTCLYTLILNSDGAFILTATSNVHSASSKPFKIDNNRPSPVSRPSYVSVRSRPANWLTPNFHGVPFVMMLK